MDHVSNNNYERLPRTVSLDKCEGKMKIGLFGSAANSDLVTTTSHPTQTEPLTLVTPMTPMTHMHVAADEFHPVKQVHARFGPRNCPILRGAEFPRPGGSSHAPAS
jgi:hypothetical protein